MAKKVPFRDGLFREGPEGAALLGGKCPSCGQVFYPAPRFCLACGHEQLQEAALSREGTLYSYTTGHVPASHYKPPYVVGSILLPENVRVMAPLQVPDAATLKTGMKMELVIDVLWRDGDVEYTGYKFKPASNG